MGASAFFGERQASLAIFEAVRTAVEALGPVESRIGKSQIAFRRRLAFAWVWMPEQYLKRPAAPLVLTVGLHRRDASPRWKQVVAPAPGRFTHHLELYTPEEVDGEVRAWLREAWAEAG